MRRLIVQAKDHPYGAQAWALRRAVWMAVEQGLAFGHAGLGAVAESNSQRQDPIWCVAPPSWKRLRRDWYLPQFLLPAFRGPFGHSSASLLGRRHQRRDQAELDGAARRRNLAGHFVVRHGRCPPAHVIVIDDVTTTGATLAEATRALRAAGAARVSTLAVAAVP